MKLINPFKCPECKKELQPEQVLIALGEEGKLIVVCGICFGLIRILN